MFDSYKPLLLVFLFFFISVCAYSQYEFKGIVKDKDTQEPLFGATVYELNTTNGTTTNLEGEFILNTATERPILKATYIGYKDIEIVAESADDLIFFLESEAQNLEGVVVTGLGIKRQKRELGYSTDQMDGESLILSNAANVVNGLSGRSAGVQVLSPNGVDGGTTRIVIRGNNNLKGNNQPLIIVDGVPIENPPGLTSVGRGVDWGSAINNINAEDIENVSILKGPTASAKYGIRGANGVVLITTKKGSNSKGLGVEYSFTTKFITPTRFRKVQNKYGAGGPISLSKPEFRTNSDGELEYPTSVHSNNGPNGRPTTEQFGFYSTGVSWGPEMLGQEVRWWDGELRTYDPQPDNLRQYFQTGTTNTYNVAISNGGEFGSFRTSLTYLKNNAVVPNSHFDQYTANAGGLINISKKITAELSGSFIKYHRKNSPSLGDDNNASFGKGILYSWPRSYQGLEKELNINPDGSRYNYEGNYPFQYTPQHLWWNTYNQNTYLDRNKFIGSVGLNYNITNWLSINGRTGVDFTNNRFETKNNPINNLGIEEASYSQELVQDIVHNSEALITAQQDNFLGENFNASISIGGARWFRDQRGIKSSANQWVTPNFFSFENTNIFQAAEEIRFLKKINSVFSFLNLSFQNAIFLEVSARNDWSSSLPIESNSFFYPSASLSYVLTEHMDFSALRIDFLKTRFSYARSATDADPFLLDVVYDINNFAQNQTAGLPSVRPATELIPQEVDSYEAGITLGLFESKIDIDLTYYNINSFQQILPSPVPGSSGANEIVINSGKLKNEGFELGINYNIINQPNGYLKAGLNLTHNQNTVISLGQGAEILELAEIWGENGPKIMAREGDTYGTIYGYDYVRHEDSGEPILNENGTHYLISENIVPVGNAAPDYLGGLNIEARYKNFKLNALIDSKIGGDIYAGSYVIGLQTGQSPETLIERDGGGLPYTDPDGLTRNVGVILPGVYANGTPNDQVVHYYYKYLPNAGGWGKWLTTPGILENTWVKMREIALSYEVPISKIERLNFIQNLNFSIVGRDLFYFYTSLPDNINPEGSTSSGNAQGLEWASFPNMRSISFRIGTKF